ncbi:type 1 fimbrial protein [Salmonella enterica subsp. enterica serovar Bareilly]|uniref:fimbrial protein n=1 Tax=Enterobacteriaceae TaxID=543 RepID=UPI000F9B774F|nr:type 1 fimbrial protein [Salmonella enterica]EBU7739033.1 type 1 fimbrial protein [Salmonella enterica subsp. enterica serovar Bareilly]HDO5013346.1 type 1 fimbrial protein [Salmonella enterica subsp. enterica serovar Typhimurium]EAX6242104.1 type 1 fimbrial protein [Salmonella enterica]EAZ0587964.1 type 1 fimbrial protein [Salmonella enterica]
MMTKNIILPGMVVAAVMLTSTSVLADTQGTQTFTANINESTCVITGYDINHDFGEITKQDLLAKGDWVSLKTYSEDKISVTGCSAGDTAVNVSTMYDEVPGMGMYGWVNNKGTAKGLGVKLIRDEASGDGFGLGGVGYDFPLVNGAVEIPVGIELARVAKSIVPDADVAVGTAKFNATIAVTVK